MQEASSWPLPRMPNKKESSDIVCSPRIVDTQCKPSCTWHGHQNLLIACTTHARTREQLMHLMTCICSSRKPWRLKDDCARLILHFAASMGRTDILSWFLAGRDSLQRPNHGAPWIDDVDMESGWTALHRAVFQGEIAAMPLLLSRGASVAMKDHDGLSPIQLLLFDHGSVWEKVDVASKEIQACYPVAFFTWGSGANYTLGFGDDQERHVPEKVRAPFQSSGLSFGRELDKRAQMEEQELIEGSLFCKNCGNTQLGALRNVAKGEIHLQCIFRPSDCDQHERTVIPSLLTVVPKMRLQYGNMRSAVDIVLRKYHTLFLSADGNVSVCGHGQGGRLGLGNEKTCLQPTRIAFKNAQKNIVAVSAGVDHSVFLDRNGAVYVCGLNEYCQLGLNPPPKQLLTPTELPAFTHNVRHGHSKKDGDIHVPVEGIAAEHFHTLFWTKTGLYACGYNGGQLGLRKDRSPKNVPHSDTAKQHGYTDLCQVLAREVTEVQHMFPARFIRCSDAALLICGANFDMVLLHEYEVKRLPKLPRLSRVLPHETVQLVEVCVFGGNLLLPGKLSSKHDLVIAVLALDVPFLYVDKAKGSWIPLSINGIPRDMTSILHIALSSDKLLLSTEFGECYTIKLSHAKRPKGEAMPFWNAERVPRIWRAVKVFSEPGSGNFAAVQLVAPFCYRRSYHNHFDGHKITLPHPFIQPSSANPDVRVVVDEAFLETERLFLLTGSLYTRDYLVNLDESCSPAVLDLSRCKSGLKPERIWDKLDAARTLQDWGKIRQLHYPNAGGIWDVEPDMKIVCDEDGATINVHRFMLTSRVMYFANLLEGDRWKDSKMSRNPVLPCNLAIGQKFVEFVYLNAILEPLWNVQDCIGLLKLADFLVHDELRQQAERFFMPSLNSDQIWPFYKLAKTYNSDILMNGCLRAMAVILPDLLETRQLANLDQIAAAQLREMNREMIDYSTRTITPHTLEGVNLSQIDNIPFGVFLPEEETDATISSAAQQHAKSPGSKKVKKLAVEASPENNHSTSATDTKQNSTSKNDVSKREPTSPKPVSVSLRITPSNGSVGVSAGSPNTSFRESSDDDDHESSASLSSSPPAFRVDALLKTVSKDLPRGLSAIMEEQRRETAFKLEKAVPFLPGVTKPKRKKFVGQKLSDVMNAARVSVEHLPSMVIEEKAPSRPKGNPWQKPVAPNSGLQEIMAHEKAVTKIGRKSPPVETRSLPPVSPSASHRSPGARSGATQPWNVPVTTVQSFSSSSRGARTVPEPVSSPVESFQHIQQEERAQLVQLHKTQSKPLNLIQLEEFAVEHLLDFYSARDNPEEWISVERVVPKQADVSWSARVH